MKFLDRIAKAFGYAPADTRPITEFTTTGGHIAVLRQYITGAENWLIRQVYIEGLKSPESTKDSSLELEADAKAYELVIVSIDGKVDDIANRALALPLPDYNEVVSRVKEVIEGKKKSETS